MIRFRIDHQAKLFRVRHDPFDRIKIETGSITILTVDGVHLELTVPEGLKVEARAWKGEAKEPGWWGEVHGS